MDIIEIIKTINKEKKNVSMADFYETVLNVIGNHRTCQLPSIIDIDCTKVLKKNVPFNLILTHEDAIKVINYKLLKMKKYDLIGININPKNIDKILTREIPSSEVYSVYGKTMLSLKTKKEKVERRIKELQDYRETLEIIGGD